MKINPAKLAPLVIGVYKTWCKTLRFDISGIEAIHKRQKDGERMVYCMWHDELFCALPASIGIKATAIISQSNDGELLAKIFEAYGQSTVRGSSSRGGLKALLQVSKRMIAEGGGCAITLDGPRGPRHIAKEGAVFIANRAKAKIVPIRFYPENAKLFEKSWDKFQLPMPFSRIKGYFGEAYELPEGKPDAEYLAVHTSQLQKKLNELGQK